MTTMYENGQFEYSKKDHPYSCINVKCEYSFLNYF